MKLWFLWWWLINKLFFKIYLLFYILLIMLSLSYFLSYTSYSFLIIHYSLFPYHTPQFDLKTINLLIMLNIIYFISFTSSWKIKTNYSTPTHLLKIKTLPNKSLLNKIKPNPSPNCQKNKNQPHFKNQNHWIKMKNSNQTNLKLKMYLLSKV